MKPSIARMALVVPLLAASAPALAQGGPAPVRVDEVISEPMRQTAPVLGRVVARQRGQVAAQVEGAIETVHVEVGDRVEKGDLLVSLDDSWHALTLSLREAALAEARADAKSATASVTMARMALDRVEGLSGTSSYSGARFDDASQELERAAAARAAAEAREASATAALEEAKLEIERSQIHAPYSGIVVARHAQPGAWLSTGDPVVTLIDDTSMEIEADVPSEQSAMAIAGTRVRAVRANGEKAEATVRAVIPEENPLTRTRAVRFTATFASNPAPLAAGESVTVHMPVGAERTVTTVHKDAIVQQPTGPTVFVVRDGKAEVQPIGTGLAVGERFEVTEGLEPGDIVVVRGNERLQPGQEVSF